MKIILSRKGFDSGAGGYPSPFFVNEGRLLSLPIPEGNKIYTADTGRLYSDLLYDNDMTYLDIMEQLGIEGFVDKNAHLDPDINQNILASRKQGWKGLFGQCDAAQQHLRNNQIHPGDLFLFLGWFKDVIRVNGRYKYVPGTDKHIIWGYMQIGEIDNIDELSQYDSWKLDHPHYRNRNRKANTGYIARESLDFYPEAQGWGVFNYNEALVLTDPTQKNRSIWRLPQFFHPSSGTKMTYHESIFNKGNKKVWELHDDHCILHSVCKGQEFVITGNDSVVEWGKKLIINSKIKNDLLHFGCAETHKEFSIPDQNEKVQESEVAANMSCIFCDNLKQKKYLLNNDFAYATYDNYPVNKGHMLVIPKRHYASYFDATPDEVLALNDMIQQAKKHLDETYKPDGYNIGVNVGETAGQTIFHLHIHIIPRYHGDVENPRGGVRNLKKALVPYDG